MSMEDILKVLVDSRRQPVSKQGADPMSELIGSLLEGSQPRGISQGGSHAPIPPQGWSPQSSGAPAGGLGLSNMMGMLEIVMGNQSGQTSMAASDPIMGLLQPYVNQLAKKMNISPEIAIIVVTFVVHKLLSHHPTSNRDSNSFDLDNMLQQMGTGQVNTSLLQSSGMVRELSRKTGLDEATTEKSLQLALGLVGKTVGNMVNKKGKSSASTPKRKSSGKGLKSKAKIGKK